MGAAKPVRRFDPKYRPVDGVGDWTELRHRDPKRFYVGALADNKGMFDVQYYLSLAEGLDMDPDDGYRVEKYTGPQGVRWRTGNTARAEGDIQMFRGYVLMSCPIEFKKLIDEIGIDGSSGQKLADMEDAKIQRTGTADDPRLMVRGREGATYVRQLSQQEMEQH